MLTKLNNDLRVSMKNQDKERTSTLRMLLSEIKYKSIEKKEKLTDSEIIAVIKSGIKSRKESIEQFQRGNRADLVMKEKNEIKILEEYLPKQLSESELSNIISDIITKTNATSKKELGKIMGELMANHKDEIDGKIAKDLVFKILEAKEGVK